LQVCGIAITYIIRNKIEDGGNCRRLAFEFFISAVFRQKFFSVPRPFGLTQYGQIDIVLVSVNTEAAGG
jgi:hypothetical protein